jgi:hypothetical protein
MVVESFELGDPVWQRPGPSDPEWLSRCYANGKASLLTPGTAVRPTFRDAEEFRSHPIGKIRQISEVDGLLRADVTWHFDVSQDETSVETVPNETSVETVPIWALTDALGID